MNVPAFLQTIIDSVSSGANIKKVFGDPIQASGKTIIPVAKICYGFGGGGGCQDTGIKTEGEPACSGEGTGGGGGVHAKPVGVYEITDTGTRFIPAVDATKIALAGLAVFMMVMMMGHKCKSKCGCSKGRS